MVEFLTFAWAYGPVYYSPFSSLLHFVDGTIIVGTFVLETVLRGQERELASLLILFRLVRFAAEGICVTNNDRQYKLTCYVFSCCWNG